MQENQLKAALREKLTQYLNAHGQRRTPERYAILETIYSLDGHFEIGQLYDIMLNHEKFRVSRATLYNTLDLLLDAKLVQRHQFEHVTQYERVLGCDPHHHAICTECGAVSEFKSNELREAISNTKIRRFTPSHSSFYLYGTCSRCNVRLKRLAKKENNKK